MTRNIPTGLQGLSQWDELRIQKQWEITDVLLPCEIRNKLNILNNTDEPLFQTVEKTCVTNILCCRSSRGFIIRIYDSQHEKVIILHRSLRCTNIWCCIPCCLQKVLVYAPVGSMAGCVEQEWRILCCCPKFSVKDEHDVELFKIKAPCLKTKIFRRNDVKFQILQNNEEVGMIKMLRPGVVEGTRTITPSICIVFPPNINVRTKAILLGACILFNFMYFEL